MKKKTLIVVAILFVAVLSGCATIDRMVKDVSSDATGGLNRTITIYSSDGQVLETYKGKIDIQKTEYGNEIKFDLNGKRIIIYNCLAIVKEN